MFSEHLEDKIAELLKDKVTLESQILNYRNKILNTEFHEDFGGPLFKEFLLKQIDKHFNIIITREGKNE